MIKYVIKEPDAMEQVLDCKHERFVADENDFIQCLDCGKTLWEPKERGDKIPEQYQYPKGFVPYMFLGHKHYECVKCGQCFCGEDVAYMYHECKEEEVKEDV